MDALPSGTVTFLFTDIEGSTRLWEAHPEEMADALASHDQVVRTAVETRGGHVVKTTGDGFLAVFSAAADGIHAAVDAQRALVATEWPEVTRLSVRMGLHSGVAQERGGDYFGSALNRAARTMAVAHGGQIVASQVTADLARPQLAESLQLVDLGAHRLRDLGGTERLYQVAADGLRADFPPLRSLDAFPSNLPHQVTSFVGREDALTGVAAALRSSRLVTLIGVGGVGKTRLALQVAADVLPAFPDGAWSCELAAAADDETAFQLVAASLGVEQRPGESLPVSIREFLRTRRTLVVLDNCEHLLDAMGQLAEDVLQECPDVRLLATSREALAIAGEQVWPLRSLPLPDAGTDPADVESADAVRLFVERARSARPDFTVDERDAAAVVEICRRLDGVPLAIELAAARTTAMSATEIAGLLDERFRLLTGGRRTAMERHRALRATVDWSYSLLDDVERQVFDRLAVFSGGFDAQAAGAVVTDEAVGSWELMDALTSLVAKSMVVADPGTDGRTRYSLLETLRQYAQDKLDAGEGADRWRRRHAQHFAERSTTIWRQVHSPDERQGVADLVADLDNFRAAVYWSIEAGGDDLGLGLTIIGDLAMQTLFNRSFGVGTWALATAEAVDQAPPGLRCAVLAAAAMEAHFRGELDGARALADAALRDGVPPDCPEPFLAPEALSMLQLFAGQAELALRTVEGYIEAFATSDDRWWLTALQLLAACWAASAGDFETAKRYGEASVAVARDLGTPSLLASALFALGWAVGRDDPSRAVGLFAESRDTHLAVAGDAVTRNCLVFRAQCEVRLGRLDLGVQCMRQAVDELRTARDVPGLVSSMALAAEVLFRAQRPEVAATLRGYLDGQATDYQQVGNVTIQPIAEFDGELSSFLGAGRYAELRAEGGRLDLSGAASLALASLDDIAAELATGTT